MHYLQSNQHALHHYYLEGLLVEVEQLYHFYLEGLLVEVEQLKVVVVVMGVTM